MLLATERGPVYLLGFVSKGTPSLSTVHTDGQIKPPGADLGTTIRGITSLFVDENGDVWMGANGNGIVAWRRGSSGSAAKMSSLLISNGLFDNQIFAFLPEGSDDVWVSCSKGFFRVTRGDMRAVASGSATKVRSMPYSPMDGLRTIEGVLGVQPPGGIGPDGRLWLSTTHGVLALNKERALRTVPVIPVAIESILVDGRETSPAQLAHLPPGRKNLEFEYTGLSFIDSGSIRFKYMLEGFDQQWIDAGTRREAVYTNLAPGNYRFRLMACTDYALCNEQDQGLPFEIASFFYQQTWFYLVATIFTFSIGWILYQFRVRRIRGQFAAVLNERNRIARELHDTLIQGFSGVTMQLQALAPRIRSTPERDALHEIIQDAGVCLKETRRSVAGLRADVDVASSRLASSIAETARHVTENTPIRLKLKLDDRGSELQADTRYHLLRIAQEALTNSVKHAHASSIDVELQRSRDQLILSIRDDGSGMPTSGAPQGDDAWVGNVESGHYGLLGMRERAAQIGARFVIRSAPNQGTEVRVTLPITLPDSQTTEVEKSQAVK
jgi:two-component sensor histidine kinase